MRHAFAVIFSFGLAFCEHGDGSLLSKVIIDCFSEFLKEKLKETLKDWPVDTTIKLPGSMAFLGIMLGRW